MKTTFLGVAIAIAWIGCGPFLAWFMRRRGYDAVSWLAVGSLLGPAALAIAVMERWSWTPPFPEVVVRGTDLGGDVNILMSIDAGEGVVSVARPLIRSLQGHIGRMTIVRVLPEGGPGEEEELAKRAIRREAKGLTGAEGVLLLGCFEDAVQNLVTNERYQFVLSSMRDGRLEGLFADSRVRYLAGGDDVHQLGCIPSNTKAGRRRSARAARRTFADLKRRAV